MQRNRQVNTDRVAWNIAAGQGDLELFADRYLADDEYIYYAPGGADIDPVLYGEDVTHTRLWRPEVDKAEFDIISLILEHKRPLIAICRGHQLVTAVVGGALHQDIYNDLGFWHDHNVVEVEYQSTLAKVLNLNGRQVAMSNSLHHQATKSLSNGWRPVAWAKDGVIEAIENPDYPGVVSVQWHPEIIGWQVRAIWDYLSEV